MLRVNLGIPKCNISWFHVDYLFFVFISWMYSCSQTRCNRNVTFQIYCMHLMHTVFVPVCIFIALRYYKYVCVRLTERVSTGVCLCYVGIKAMSIRQLRAGSLRRCVGSGFRRQQRSDGWGLLGWAVLWLMWIFTRSGKFYVSLIDLRKTFTSALTVCFADTLSVCLSVCLFICLSVCLSVCLFICLSVCLSVRLSVFLWDCLSFVLLVVNSFVVL